MEETANHVVTGVSDKFIEQGVMGASMMLFFIISAVLLWVILKDKQYQKIMADALSDMVENQKSFNTQYQASQLHHKEVLALIAETAKIERQNTKECYEKVEQHLTKLLMINKVIT